MIAQIKKVSIGFALALAAASALASDATDIMVHDPYVRLAPPSATTTAAYMSLMNMAHRDIKLVKAATTVAKATELHTHINDNGVMQMRPVAAIEIKAHGDTDLKPGGLHIMLIDLAAPLKEGEKVRVTLTFEDGSSQQVDAPVLNAIGKKDGEMNHAGH